VVAWCDGRPERASAFLALVRGMARALPAGGDVINLCADRYRFAVTFLAVVLAGGRNLLPQNRTPATLDRLRAGHPDALMVVDDGTAAAAGAGSLEWTAFAASGRVDGFAIPHVAADHVAALVFTSGSTGQPKPIVKRWGTLVDSAHAEREALALAAPFHVLATVPPQHMYGLESSLFMPLVAGAAFHAGRPLFPHDIATALESMPAPRVLVTAPIHVRACVEGDADFPALALVLSAAAPLPVELAHAAETRFDTRVAEIYGFTEAGMVAARRTVEGPVWRTLPGVRLHRTVQGWGFAGGHVDGERTPGDAIAPVTTDDDRHFTLAGRQDDMVNVAGKRASLAELSAHLVAMPGVLDGIFHAPDPGPGDAVRRLMAFVVAPGLAARDIRGFLQARIDAAFLPRPLVLVDALPRTAAGKLPREAVAALAAQYVAMRGRKP